MTTAPETSIPDRYQAAVGREAVEREKVRFVSGDTTCAAWHYPGTNGGCVVMAGGFAVTMGPGTDRFAQQFKAAGFTVLAFDHRHLGESGGQPRQVVRVREQLTDWQAAVTFASTLPDVDPARVAIWGFSASGGHVFRVAARNTGLAAAIAQTPNADGQAAARNAARHQRPGALLRFTGRAVLDALGGLVGRQPRLVPLTGEPGTVAVLTTPDAIDGGRVLAPDNTYPDWRQEVAARSALRHGFYRPGRAAARVPCPLLVLVCDQDQSALAEPAVRAAQRAPAGELVRMPGGHYEPFRVATTKPSKPSWRSCADTCSTARDHASLPRPDLAGGPSRKEDDAPHRPVRRNHRLPRHRRRRPHARAAARAPDGRLPLGRRDR